jgi:hypothetical protein
MAREQLGMGVHRISITDRGIQVQPAAKTVSGLELLAEIQCLLGDETVVFVILGNQRERILEVPLSHSHPALSDLRCYSKLCALAATQDAFTINVIHGNVSELSCNQDPTALSTD